MAQVKVNAWAYSQLVKHMLEGTYNCRELAELTGLHYVTVLTYTREMHKSGACHICMWEQDSRGRDMVKVYKIGAGRDAKRFKLTPAERQARVRAKKRELSLHHSFRGSADASSEE